MADSSIEHEEQDVPADDGSFQGQPSVLSASSQPATPEPSASHRHPGAQSARKLPDQQHLQLEEEDRQFSPAMPIVYQNIRTWLRELNDDKPKTRRKFEKVLGMKEHAHLLKAQVKVKASALIHDLVNAWKVLKIAENDTLRWDIESLGPARQQPDLRTAFEALLRKPGTPLMRMHYWVLFGNAQLPSPMSSPFQSPLPSPQTSPFPSPYPSPSSSPAPSPTNSPRGSPKSSRRQAQPPPPPPGLTSLFSHLPTTLAQLKQTIRQNFCNYEIRVSPARAFRHLIVQQVVHYRFPNHGSDDDSNASDSEEYLSEDLEDLPLVYDEEALSDEKPEASLTTRLLIGLCMATLLLSMLIGAFFN